MLNTAHEVEADEIEEGVGGEARSHEVDLVLADVQLRLDYGLSQTLDLTVILPLRRVSMDAEFFDAQDRRLPGFQSIHHRDEVIAGLGDLALEAGLHLGGGLTLRLGVSLPTGGVEPDPYALGGLGLRHQHIFFGSGTVDPRLGVAGGWRVAGLELRAVAEATGAVYENDDGYRAGWNGFGQGAVATSLGLEPFVFVARVGLFHALPSTWNGRSAENTGRTDLLPGLAVEVPWGDWFFSVEASRPINLVAEGGQLDAPLVAGLAVGVRLPVIPPQSSP